MFGWISDLYTSAPCKDDQQLRLFDRESTHGCGSRRSAAHVRTPCPSEYTYERCNIEKFVMPTYERCNCTKVGSPSTMTTFRR